MDLTATDLDLTFAVHPDLSLGAGVVGSHVRHVKRLSAFGNLVKLVTVRLEGIGLHPARFDMISSTEEEEEEENEAEELKPGDVTKQENTTKSGGVEIEKDEEGVEVLRSECMNPITEVTWSYRGNDYRVKGKAHPDYELVRERNGPFAGKRQNRPVASYDGCHRRAVDFLSRAMAADGEKEENEEARRKAADEAIRQVKDEIFAGKQVRF